MMTRRSLEGALKCALRDFRREEASPIVKKPRVSILPIQWLSVGGLQCVFRESKISKAYSDVAMKLHKAK